MLIRHLILGIMLLERTILFVFELPKMRRVKANCLRAQSFRTCQEKLSCFA